LIIYCSFFEELMLFDREFQEKLLQDETLLSKILIIAKLQECRISALRLLINFCHQSTYAQNYVTSDIIFLKSLFSDILDPDINHNESLLELAILSIGLLVNLIEDNEFTHNIIYPHMPLLISSYVYQSKELNTMESVDHLEIFMSYYALFLLIMYDPIRAGKDFSWNSLYQDRGSNDLLDLLTKRVQRCLWIQQQMSQLHREYFQLDFSKTDLHHNSIETLPYELSPISENMRKRLVYNLKHLEDNLYL
jgi:hypothetical protein